MAIKKLELSDVPVPKLKKNEQIVLHRHEFVYAMPFPVKLRAYKLFGFSTHRAFYDWALESDRKTLGKVKLSSLIATQEDLDESNLHDAVSLLQHGEEEAEPILVVRFGKFYLIIDGHHRAAAAYAVGNTSIKVIVINPKIKRLKA